MAIKRKHYEALRQAVEMARDWRGSLTGNYGNSESIAEEDERLSAFDAHMKLCKDALSEVRRELKAYKTP